MKFSRSPIEMAELVANGVGDAECAAWQSWGMRVWLKAEGKISLQRGLGLPETPERLRLEQRDRHLLAALELLEGEQWARAKVLARLICEFEARRWAAWRRAPSPPAHASPVDRRLFYAFHARSLRMPRTAQGVLKVANKTGEKS